MRVLIDNCLPVDLRHHLHGHDFETAAYRGWGGLENGELVGAAVEAGFEALITVDQGTDMARASRGQAIASYAIPRTRSLACIRLVSTTRNTAGSDDDVLDAAPGPWNAPVVQDPMTLV